MQSNNNVLVRGEQQLGTNKGNQNTTYQAQEINGNESNTSWRLSPANSGYVYFTRGVDK